MKIAHISFCLMVLILGKIVLFHDALENKQRNNQNLGITLMLSAIFTLICFLCGCVSLGWHERQMREARGEATVRVTPGQEYKNFMEHKINENAEIGEPYK